MIYVLGFCSLALLCLSFIGSVLTAWLFKCGLWPFTSRGLCFLTIIFTGATYSVVFCLHGKPKEQDEKLSGRTFIRQVCWTVHLAVSAWALVWNAVSDLCLGTVKKCE